MYSILAYIATTKMQRRKPKAKILINDDGYLNSSKFFFSPTILCYEKYLDILSLFRGCTLQSQCDSAVGQGCQSFYYFL